VRHGLTGALLGVELMALGVGSASGQNDGTANERLAARIALAELTTSLTTPLDSAQIHWLLVPEGRPVTTNELLGFMREFPKPAQCRATAGGTVRQVEVHCERASDSLAAYIQLSADFIVKRLRDAWRNADEEQVDVLVETFQERLVVPYRAFDLWLRSYHVDAVAAHYAFDPPPNEAVRLGARMTVTIARRVGSP
jgi:hypothetical protein